MKFWSWFIGEENKDYLPIVHEHLNAMRLELSLMRGELAELRKDVNALRVAQAKAQHRQAAEVAPETLGKPFGLTKEQSEQVDWSRVR